MGIVRCQKVISCFSPKVNLISSALVLRLIVLIISIKLHRDIKKIASWINLNIYIDFRLSLSASIKTLKFLIFIKII